MRSYPKERRISSEPYRRLVAGLPCSHCLIQGSSQAAHENPVGKALGKKLVSDDRTFPMCHEGAAGCHTAFDQYRLIDGGREAHQSLARIYVEKTKAALRELAKHDAAARQIVTDVIGLE